MRKFLFLFLFLSTSPLLAKNKILFIGDSHSVLDFGQALAKTIPHTYRYAVSASASSAWLRDRICPAGEECPYIYGYATPAGEEWNKSVPPDFPGFKLLLRKIKAETVIIALGTNDANQRCHLDLPEGVQPVADLLDLVGNRKCYWVGPPRYDRGPLYETCGENYEKYVEAMKKIIEERRCTFIDSRLILNPETGRPIEANTKDQIHFDVRLGAFWGHEVARKIK